MSEKVVTTKQRLEQLRTTMTISQIVKITGLRRREVLRILGAPMKQVAPLKRKEK